MQLLPLLFAPAQGHGEVGEAGGTRGRGGGSSKMTREDQIEEKRAELSLTLVQLDQYKTNRIVVATLSSISVFTGGMRPTIIKEAMGKRLALRPVEGTSLGHDHSLRGCPYQVDSEAHLSCETSMQRLIHGRQWN